MGLYGRGLLPTLIDVAMRGDDIDRLRARVLAACRGRTLGVGFGTGLNARHDRRTSTSSSSPSRCARFLTRAPTWAR